MTTYPITMVNPGAELGNTSGWVYTGGGGSGGGFTVSTTSPHSGTYKFETTGGLNTLTAKFKQTVTVDPSYYTAIDNGLFTLFGSGWHLKTGTPTGGILNVRCLDADSVVLNSVASAVDDNTSWTQVSVSLACSVGTRFIEVETDNGEGFNKSNSWDDFELYFEDIPADEARAFQLGAYIVSSHVADQARSSQFNTYVLAASETSSGLYHIKSHQLFALVLTRSTPRRRRMQAWAFSLDGHDFYVLNLAGEGTIVVDLATGQWSEWRTFEQITWRARIGQNWLGMGPDTMDRLYGTNIVCGDDTLGVLWVLDPTQGFDDSPEAEGDDEPFVRYVTGMVPVRMRETISCAGVYVNLSLGAPTVTGAAMHLRTSDDGAQTWYDHGSVTITPGDYTQEVAWRGLGLIRAQSRVFEFTDSGAAVRINAANMTDPR